MRKKVTKREILAFLLGTLIMLFIIVMLDWQDFRHGFKEGVKNAYSIENSDNQ